MSTPIGFRSRRDVLRLIAAGITPLLLLVIAKAPLRILQALFKTQAEAEPFASFAIIWFYPVTIAAMILSMSLFLFGAWRIIRNRQYRWSFYGWIWLVVMWLDLGLSGYAHDPF